MTHAILKKSEKPLSKLLVVFLVFMFFITPLAPVLADQVDGGSSDASATSDAGATTDSATQSQDPQSTDSSSQADTGIESAAPAGAAQETALPDEPATDSATDSTLAEEQTATDSAASPSPSGGSPSPDEPPVSQPSGSNSLLSPKLPEIDKNTGALHYNYSITIPPGRNNLQPDLQLSYNSNSNEQNGAFGYGFSLSIPFIQRLNKAGTDKLYTAGTASYFYSSQDGELVPAQGASYIAKTENGSFNKYAFSDNTWQVLSKDGTKYIYGVDDASRQNDPQNPDNVYKWMLKEIRDANDNYISFSYVKDAGQIYPSVITYTGNGVADGIFEIDFLRAQRPDNSPSFTTGFSVVSNYYINEIIAKVSGSQVTRYVLSYAKSKDSNRSLLKSVTMSGKDSSGNITTLPETSFDYQSSGSGWTQTPLWALPTTLPTGETTWQYPGIPPQFTDLNGDGLTDLVVVASHYNTGNIFTYYQYLNTGSGWTQTSLWNFPALPAGETDWQNLAAPPQFTDLNGDGLTDLILLASHYNTGNIFTYYQYLNTGSGWALTTSWKFPSSLPVGETEWSYFHQFNMPPQFTDLNGDGLTDLVVVAGHYNTGNIFTYYQYLNTGSGWALAPSWKFPSSLPVGETDWQYPGRPPQFTELNGDGLTDLVVVASHNYYGQVETYYQYLNTGSGWALTTSWKFPSSLPVGETDWQYPGRSPQFTDLNGDGLTDLIVIASHYNYGLVETNYQYLNISNGWTQTASLAFPVTLPVGETSWRYPGRSSQFADLNGDGLADLLVVASHDYYGQVETYYQYLNGAQKRDLLAQITYPQGGATDITYKAAAQYTDSAGNPTNKSPYP